MPERLADVIEDLGNREGLGAQRVTRLALAMQEEVRILVARIDGLDPVQVVQTGIRPMADLERDAILHAVRTLGNAALAAHALDLAPATVYRKLKQYAAESRRTEPHEAHKPTDDRRDGARRRSGDSPGRPANKRWPFNAHGHVLPAERAPDARSAACGTDPERRSAQPPGAGACTHGGSEEGR
jgi:hypothetical protein